MLKFLNSKLQTPTWLFVLLFIVFVLRIPSFFEPYSYGDEMIYLTLGEAIRHGVPLYKGVHDNKPPLLYILAAVTGNLFWFKALLAGWHMITVYLFWRLSRILFFKNEKVQIIATSLFALFTTIPLLEGNIINSELFMVGPVILGFLILLAKKNNFKNLIGAGALFSIAALFKIPAAFELPVIVTYWFLTEIRLNKKTIISIFKKSLILGIGFLTPILLTFIWFYLEGALKEYVVAAFLQNFGYLSSFRPGDTQKPFLVKNGPLLLRGLIVIVTISILYIKRKKLSKEFIFATIWLFFTLFAVTLSERPYPHYLIQSVGPISLLLSILVAGVNIEQLYSIIPLTVAFFVPVYFKFWYYPTAPYYLRFVQLITNNTPKDKYLETFGSQVPRNYKLAKYVMSATNEHEKIFVWGDGVPVYAMSKRLPPGKYVADYHIKDFSTYKETLNIIENDLPVFIIIEPNSEPFPGLSNTLAKNYAQIETIDGAEVWKLLSPKIRSLYQ